MAVGLIDLIDQQTINAEDNIVAQAMSNIDAEYKALCQEFALVTV